MNELSSSNKVLVSIPPNNKIDVVLTNFDKIFKKNSFNWVTYLSATSVYGDKKGKWVDEESDPILFHRTINKLVILGKAGLLDHDSVMKLRSSFKVMLDGKVPSSQQRAVLLTVLDKLITLVTSDMSLFNRIRSDLQRDKTISKK